MTNTNTKFEIKIDRETYTNSDVRKWAKEIDMTTKELLEKLEDWDEKQWAMFAYCEFDPDYIEDIDNLDIGEDEIEIGNKRYYCLTDDEADLKADEYLDEYIDDCVLSQLPDNLQNYLDSEKFKKDVLCYDGRGSQLASYDGCEYEFTVNDTTYYIYRID